MTNSEEYLREQFPDTYYVLGHRMATFTLGHAMLLERLKSPFVVPTGNAPGWGDLRLAIAACSRSFPRARRLMTSRWLKWRLATLVCPSNQLLLGLVQMSRYIEASRVMPTCWGRGDENARPAGAPFLQLIKITHMMYLHKTELQALCTPFGSARWDYAGCWEIKGNLRILSEDDKAANDRARELFEQRTARDQGPATPNGS